MRAPPRRSLERRAAEEAAEILGLGMEGLTLSAVQGAFRRLLRLSHPDTAPTQEALVDAQETLATLQRARATLLQWIEETPDVKCRVCRGVGYIRAGMVGTRPCPRCQK